MLAAEIERCPRARIEHQRVLPCQVGIGKRPLGGLRIDGKWVVAVFGED